MKGFIGRVDLMNVSGMYQSRMRERIFIKGFVDCDAVLHLWCAAMHKVKSIYWVMLAFLNPKR